MTPEDMQARVLYRDGLILVIDKPAGLAVHRGPKGGDNLEAHFDALRFGLPRSPALAHRLDRETSGCLVLGRHHKALMQLGLMFKQGKIGKTYWAVVVGGPVEDEGLVDLPLTRRDPGRGWWMRVDALGQKSQTRWTVVARDGIYTLLALTPLTGRTHQLRVHCSAMGFPILGDAIYGDAPVGGERLHLHAKTIEIPLYKNKESLKIEAPLPQHMQERVAGLLGSASSGQAAQTPDMVAQ